LVVKNMFYHKNFGGGAMATTMFKGYPLGSSLFLYFFVRFGFSFQPAYLYMALNLLNISLLLPVVARFKNNKQKLGFFACLVAIVLTFNIKTFASIWNDQFMAIAFAYILISYFCFINDEGLNKINLISLCLGTFILVSSKSTGLILVLLAYVIIALDLLINRRNLIKNNKKKTALAVLFAVIAILIPKISWSIYLKFIDVGGAWETDRLTLANVISYIFAPNAFEKQVTKNFFLEFLWPFKCKSNAFSTPIPYWIIVGIFVGLIVLIKKKSKASKIGLTLSLGVFITFFAYTTGTLISYIFTFSNGEALTLASFVRYMNTYVLGIVLFLFAYFISMIDVKEETKFNGKILAVVAVGMFAISGVVCPIVNNKMQKTIKPYQTFIEGVSRLEKTDKVYIVDVTEDRKSYLLMRFMATPTDTSGLRIGGSPYIGDVYIGNRSFEEICEDIKNGNYNYLYLHNIDDNFINKYSILFKTEIKEKSFYKIEINNNKIELINA